MKIVMDEKIPFLRDALTEMGCSVTALPGVEISDSDLLDVDALFVRTRTRCDASLLGGTSVRFIGTATIGYDHIDADYCAANGIEWVSAPGCNADAVLQYVQSSVYAWAAERGVSLPGLTLGVVGVGRIGSRVAAWAESAGMRVLLNDPPRAARGDGHFVSIGAVAAECDIITFHPTLSRTGQFPSYHLADAAFFASLRRRPLLINASRGAVVDNAALLQAVEAGLVADAVVDVWEGEPDINLSLLNKVYIATPHIAGYSAEGKLNASRMMLEAFARFFCYNRELPRLSLPQPADSRVVAATVADALLAVYNPVADSERLKARPDKFEDLRNNYTLRREPSAFEFVIK